MAGEGGDTGTSGKGAGGDSGFDDTGSGNSFGSDTASYGGGGTSGEGFGSGAADFANSGGSVSGGGGLDQLVGSGDGGGDGGGAGGGAGVGGAGFDSIGGSDILNDGSGGGFNLAGSGPVGGLSQPVASGGMFTSDTTPGASPVTQDTNVLGTTVPSGGGGTSAAAFAAPTGVGGNSDLTSWVSNPAGNSAEASPYAYDNSNILSSLDPAAMQAGANVAPAGETAGEGASVLGSASSTTLSSTTPAAAGAGAAPLSSGSSGGSSSGGGNSQTTGILNDLGGTKGLGVAAAAAGLLNNLVNSPKSTPAVGALNANAATATANSQEMINRGYAQGDQYGKPALDAGQSQVAKGQVLQNYVATGKLPQGYEDQVQQAAQSAKQTIISNYANRGLPTDPTMNSSLAQELAQVDARLPAMREQLAAQLATTGNSIVGSGNATSATGNQLTGNQLLTDGLQAAGISSNVYSTLANLENDKNKQQGQAIANFAAALNGGTKSGININVGGTKAA